MSDAPNFRITVRLDSVDEADVVHTTFERFALENEAVPRLVESVETLAPGEEVRFGDTVVKRIVVSPPRYTRVRVPIDLKEFRGAEAATITIDRKRLTLSIRPIRRRTVVELPLGELAERYLAKQVKLDAIARKKAQRARR